MRQQRYAYLIRANGPETGQLKYAEKDAMRLANALMASPCLFTKAEAITAQSRGMTLTGLKRCAEQCEPSALFLVHFSGHAIFDEQLYLLCNDTDVNDLVSSALEINALKTILRRCKARYKVLILDCCHAAGAHGGALKSVQDMPGMLYETVQGSATVILSACSRRVRTRELDTLDGGAGFLSWAVRTACTTHFHEASPDYRSLSLMDIWRWVTQALEMVNSDLSESDRLPPPVLLNEQEGGLSGEIWLTEQRRDSIDKAAYSESTRKKYLENVCKRYSSVTLPLGLTEDFSLQAVFQPLALRRDPLAAEDLERKKRRALLGESLLDEDDHTRSRLGRHERGSSNGTQQSLPTVIADHGEDALKKTPHGRLVILGGPGTGKTTTLKHFISCRAKEALLDPKAPVPIYLSLADLARSGKTLQRYLIDVVENMGVESAYGEILWKEIDAGHAFLCLDSLDEVDPNHRAKIIELINTWASEPGNTWIIGSRFTEYKGGLFKRGQFSDWELLPMNHDLRLELAQHLLPELQRLLQLSLDVPLSAATFVMILEQHPQAAAWGENPLLFSLAAVVFLQTKGLLPSSRAILYREVIEAILKTREQSLVWGKVLWRLLTQFALWLHQTKGRTFSINDLLTFLADVQGKSWEETADLANRIIKSGVMEPVARDTYGFRHQTFQEYLAAAELARQLTSQDPLIQEVTWKLAWSKRTYSRWTEVLRLMVGALMQVPEKVGRVKAFRWLEALRKQRETVEGDPGNLGMVQKEQEPM